MAFVKPEKPFLNRRGTFRKTNGDFGWAGKAYAKPAPAFAIADQPFRKAGAAQPQVRRLTPCRVRGHMADYLV
jgi:hypothetical protein